MKRMVKESRATLKRLDIAREYAKTCPASRHVQMIIENMVSPKCQMHTDLRQWWPDHMAGSIAVVLEELWKARRWLEWDTTKQEWVPDLDAIEEWRVGGHGKL